MTIDWFSTSTRWMIGSSIVRGRSPRILAIASFTSLTARSVLISSRNSAAVTDWPSVMVEVMCLMPETPATASSTRLVICVSISDGAEPCSRMVTETTGTSMLGKRVIGSVRKEMIPSATSTTKRRMGGTGLRIAQAEMFQFIARPPRSASRCPSRSA